MASPFIGEIRMLACTFAPIDWAICDGSLVAISQNDALFNLIGTIYGGDGQETFALPDFRGRLPIHAGTGGGATYVQGQAAGSETVTLSLANVPAHSHSLAHAPNGKTTDPAGGLLATTQAGTQMFLAPPGTMVTAAAGSVGTAGSGAPAGHSNLMPALTLTFAISLFGIFPSPS
ncbi:MAG: phage tail protein [Verrucomicrobia bacterium]|nr:phage tail protein [Verrucomicrobiota bacterium]